MQNRCQVHIKFHEKAKSELYFNIRSYPMKAEIKAEWNFEQSFIKTSKEVIVGRARLWILISVLCQLNKTIRLWWQLFIVLQVVL